MYDLVVRTLVPPNGVGSGVAAAAAADVERAGEKRVGRRGGREGGNWTRPEGRARCVGVGAAIRRRGRRLSRFPHLAAPAVTTSIAAYGVDIPF